MPLPIYCHRNDQGYSGDDVGKSAKFCNDFFITPSDTGMCLTKNLDIKKILKDYKKYDVMFESDLQSTQKIEKGTTLGRLTLLFLMPNDYYSSKTHDHGLPDLKIHLHQSKDLGSLLLSDTFDFFSIPMSLKKNHAYSVKITPYGQHTSEEFRSLNQDKRECRLADEVPEGSIFKIYTQSNCKYECRVKLASNICHCTPWDFLFLEKRSECDVFGRTCFTNAMANLTLHQDMICKECVQECDFYKFKKELIDSSIVSTQDETMAGFTEGTKQSIGFIGKYLSCHYGFVPNCKGEGAFIDFFYDENNTFTDESYVRLYQTLGPGRDSAYVKGKTFQYSRALNLYDDAIIVDLNFFLPEVDYVDVKYTMLDKIANFGGKFGIFAQLTGCSLLGLLNIVMIFLKCFFVKRQD